MPRLRFRFGWPVALVLSLLLTKKMVVYAPLCHEHRGIFTRRKVISVTLVVLGLGSLFGSIALGAALQQPNQRNDVGPVAVLIGLGLMLVLLVASVVVSSIGIGASEITDRDIKLKGVHEDFKEALIEQRQAERDERKQRRSSRRDDYEEDDYDDRPRRGRRRYDD